MSSSTTNDAGYEDIPLGRVFTAMPYLTPAQTNHQRQASSTSAVTGASNSDNNNNNGNGNSNTDISNVVVPGEKAGKIELKPADVLDQLPISFSRAKKWGILIIIFFVQISMNLNTTLYSSGIPGMAREFGISESLPRLGAALFLIAYAFGCELWAPWSEELGRKLVLQVSMLAVNLFAIPVGGAGNIAIVLICRTLGGLATAGGSVTLAVITDMFDSHDDDYQYATAFIVFSSVAGSVVGPICGGFFEERTSWRWTIWVQLFVGAAVQLIHFLLAPETRTTSVLDSIAKRMRKEDPACNIYGPGEMEKSKFEWREAGRIWVRPFLMFVTEPIVLFLSFLSGFSDALIFMQVQAFGLVYAQWEFTPIKIGYSFLPLLVGYVAAFVAYIPFYRRNMAARKRDPRNEHAQYEARLKPLLYFAPCLPAGLIIFAWTSGGPPLPWAASFVGSFLIGIANYAVYASTIEYMVKTYGAEYSASATGGNGFARDFLAGVLTMPAVPLYTTIAADKDRNFEYASTILFCISFLLVAAVWWVYFKGAWLRKKSKFAQTLVAGDEN